MPVTDGPLTPFAEGIWVDTAPVRFLGMQLTTTMTVLRLGDGNLLLYSPVALTQARQSAIEALGPVAHLYAPNLFHHRWIGEWAAAFPSALLHAPVGLAKKRGDLRIDRIHNAAREPAFTGVLEELPIDGFRLDQIVQIEEMSLPDTSPGLTPLAFACGTAEHLPLNREQNPWKGEELCQQTPSDSIACSAPHL